MYLYIYIYINIHTAYVYIYIYIIHIYIYIYILYITELNSTVECPPKTGAASEPKSFVAERKSVSLGPSQMGGFLSCTFWNGFWGCL